VSYAVVSALYRILHITPSSTDPGGQNQLLLSSLLL